ncbi:MAG: hypothetical protein ACK587_13485 [Cyanobacteriota bacterium]
MKTRHFLVSLGFAAGMSLLASPAQAGTAAPLAACPTLGFTLDAFAGGGPTVGCTVGDKNFTNFIYSGTLPAGDVSVVIGGTAQVHTINFTGIGASPFWSFGNNQSIKYDVTVNNLSTFQIAKLAGGMTTSLPGTAAIGTIDPSVTHTGTCLDNVSFDCTSSPIIISPLVETMTVSNEFNVTSTGSTGITQISNSIIQTPGPLPVIGVGVALGMSRKIRRRITSAA